MLDEKCGLHVLYCWKRRVCTWEGAGGQKRLRLTWTCTLSCIFVMIRQARARSSTQGRITYAIHIDYPSPRDKISTYRKQAPR
jgi:hypothetical protein